ncbi:endopeptidase La [Acidobacteriota bacterium]
MVKEKQFIQAQEQGQESARIQAPDTLPEPEADEMVIPEEIPILPLKNTVVYPTQPATLHVARKTSMDLVDSVIMGDRLLGLIAQKEEGIETPTGHDLFTVGTVVHIHKMLKFPDGTERILVRGLKRFRVKEFTKDEPFLAARIEFLDNMVPDAEKEIEALIAHLLNQIKRLHSLMPYIPEEAIISFFNIEDPGELADLSAAQFGSKLEEKQEILETLDVLQRLKKSTRIIGRELEMLELGHKIQKDIQKDLEGKQKEYMLRQQLKAIQEQLGEGEQQETRELKEKIDKAGMPEEVKKVAEKELERLSTMQPGAAEYTVARTYLDWLVDLPWSASTEDKLDIVEARRILDEDHFGLSSIKDRIIEYLSVLKLKADMKGPILCYVGPPGTGKTSIGRSIARAMGRKFHRLSLGGVRDEAEIRGHRRTYVGALPGRIIQAIRKAGTNNPVIMLDEVDKLGNDFRGDPSSALLEVLDPEQNFAFSDHYLEVPFDLSKVMFITTANLLEPIPGPLRDRMEVIEFPGYTREEKLEIAKRHLLPKQIDEHGIKPAQIAFTDDAIRKIVSGYTREAGVRNLERQIARVCRKVASHVAAGQTESEEITAEKLHEYLSYEKFYQEIAERTDQPGVAVGLAWTPTGGEILFVESTSMAGSGRLTLTGQLGDVMKESAQAAMSILRSRAEQYKFPDDFFKKHDIHVHVPQGAIPKDGPSAGVAITSSLFSLVSDKPCRPDTAATGEITLRGKVLPVGGIKEKVLGASRAGIKRLILPRRNEKDVLEMKDTPGDVLAKIEFIYVDTIEEALQQMVIA